MSWPPWDIWRAYWAEYYRSLFAETRTLSPEEERRRRNLEEIRQAHRETIEDNERIRCLLDKSIKKARTLDDDIVSLVNDMVQKRDETPPQE
jgi:hypothetical protein